MGDLDKLRRFYEERRREINKYLQEGAARGQSTDDKELFCWLCHNLLTVQVNYDKVLEAINHLEKSGLLFRGDVHELEDGLRGCGYRFTNKAKYLHEARVRFFDDECEIGIVAMVRGLKQMDPVEARNLLADHVSGMGMKTASHFLRGLGLSHNQLAILDTHILGWLEKFRVVKDLPRNTKGKLKYPTKNQYLCYEKKMIDWNNTKVHIPLDKLDQLLWEMKDC